MIDEAIVELTGEDIGVSVEAAGAAVGRARSSHYRRVGRPQGPPASTASRKGQAQPRALSQAERA